MDFMTIKLYNLKRFRAIKATRTICLRGYKLMTSSEWGGGGFIDNDMNIWNISKMDNNSLFTITKFLLSLVFQVVIVL